MNIKHRLLVLGCSLLLLASCASKPPAVEEPPVTETPVVETPVEPVVETPVVVEEPKPDPAVARRAELAELHARVLELRKQAVDLEANTRLAADYDNADAKYIQGKQALDADELDTAEQNLLEARELFTGLIARSYENAIATQKQLVASLQGQADTEPVRTNSHEVLLLAADAEQQALRTEQEGSAAEALAAWIRTRLLYDGAIKHAKALQTRQRIEALGFGSSDAGNYATADAKRDLAYSIWPDDLEKALEAIEEALLRYNLVLAKGWELQAGGKRAMAESVKLQADQIKAAVAVARLYAAAKAVWDSANDALSQAEHEYAANLFEQAESQFAQALAEAQTKRAAAEAAMAAALERQNRSLTVAQQADQALGLEPEAPVTPDTNTPPEAAGQPQEQGE